MNDRHMASQTVGRAVFSMRGDLAMIEQHSAALGRDDLNDLVNISLRLLELIKSRAESIAA